MMQEVGRGRETPIIMTGHSVRSILAGTKTQTRRAIRIDTTPVHGDVNIDFERWRGSARGIPPNAQNVRMCGMYLKCDAPAGSDTVSSRIFCPYGWIDDKIWVREAHALIWPGEDPPEDERDCRIEFRADGDESRLPGNWPADMRSDPERPKWRPSIFMKRWMSRLTLVITDLRVERLQSITEGDARSEGAEPTTITGWDGQPTQGLSARDVFAIGWDKINGKRAGCSWADDPYVWVITFRVEERAP